MREGSQTANCQGDSIPSAATWWIWASVQCFVFEMDYRGPRDGLLASNRVRIDTQEFLARQNLNEIDGLNREYSTVWEDGFSISSASTTRAPSPSLTGLTCFSMQQRQVETA